MILKSKQSKNMPYTDNEINRYCESVEKLLIKIEEMASLGYRVLGVAKALSADRQLPADQKDFKFEFPELTISNGKSSKRFVFPLGTIIWKDKKEKGSIIVRYMDKRFSAFGSDAYALIDFINLDVITIVTDVIYEIESHNDEYLIGIQRIPKEVDYLDDSDDTDYNNSCQVLFVIKIDFKNRKFLRLNILTSSALPDNNQVFSQNESESIKSKFYVNDGILYYKKGDTIRRFILSDFNKKATHRNIKEINAQQKNHPTTKYMAGDFRCSDT